MKNIKLELTHEERGLLLDMFSCVADLGLFDDPAENEQDSCPDLFDKTWDKVIHAEWWPFFILNSTIPIENPGRSCSVCKLSTFYPIRSNLMYSKKVQSNSPMNDFVDPRFEDDAIAALMEDALTETRDDKFDVEKFIEGDLDYWT